MKLEISTFLCQFIILFYNYNFVIAKPMFGRNVREANGDQPTFVVSLKRINTTNPEPETDHFCSGILITKRDVLTTEHCINKKDHSSMELVIGSTDIRRGRIHHVYWWITYEQWIEMLKTRLLNEINDIVNIRLLENVPDEIQPAVLLPEINLFGLKSIISGWSRTEVEQTSRYLKSADVRIMKNGKCEERIYELTGERVEMPNNMVCSYAAPFAIMTEGDSGGPLIHNDKVIGITRGFCPTLDMPLYGQLVNVHHTIEYYIIFIRDIIHNY